MADLVVVGVKVPPSVKERWLECAGLMGVSLSVWVRGACEERAVPLLAPRGTVTAGGLPSESPNGGVPSVPVSVGTPLPAKMRDEAPRVFRDGCSGSHVGGVPCSVCGGRMW